MVTWMAAALAIRQDDEAIRLKGGEIVSGKITVEEKGLLLQKTTGEQILYLFERIEPESSYNVLRKRIDKNSAKDLLWLADFCKRFGLIREAERHIKEAIDRAPDRRDEILKLQKEIHAESAKQKFKTAKDIVDGRLDKRFEEAARLLHEIIEKYEDTAYFEEAQKLDARLKEDVTRLVKDREAALEAAKKAAEAARKEKEAKEFLDKGSQALAEAEIHWRDGLEAETRNQGAAAINAWGQGEGKLRFARENIRELLRRARDPEVVRKLNEQHQQVERWLIRLWLAIARLSAVDSLDFIRPMRWVNEVLKLDPDNERAMQRKMTLTEAAIRARIEAAAAARPPR